MTEDHPSGFLVTLYGTAHCQKTLYYRNVLDERRVAYRFADVASDPEAAKELIALTGSAEKFPTFSIGGRKLRNPSLLDLETALTRL